MLKVINSGALLFEIVNLRELTGTYISHSDPIRNSGLLDTVPIALVFQGIAYATFKQSRP